MQGEKPKLRIKISLRIRNVSAWDLQPVGGTFSLEKVYAVNRTREGSCGCTEQGIPMVTSTR